MGAPLRIVPTSPLVRVDTGQVLSFDAEQIESVELQMPIDTIDVTPPDATDIEYKLGKSHIILKITFTDGHRPKWTDATEVGEEGHGRQE